MGDVQDLHRGDRSGEAGTVLSVIVVTFNNAETIESCLSSIPDEGVEIIVVDNASRDATRDRIETGYPAVRFLRSATNTGFAAAVNLGVSVSRGKRILLVNPDAVLGPDCVPRLLAVAERAPRHGIYGGNATDPGGRTNRLSGLNRPTLRGVASAALGLRAAFPGSSVFDPEAVWPLLDGPGADTVPVDVVSGSCLLIARDLWDRLGGFDRRYFMYGEDADLCLRARQLGCDPVIVRDARLVHRVAGSETSRAATRTYVLTAKSTLARLHGPWMLRICVDPLHRLHVLLRLAGTGLLGLAIGRNRTSWSEWRQVWRDRAVWTGGYPPHVPDPLRSAAPR